MKEYALDFDTVMRSFTHRFFCYVLYAKYVIRRLLGLELKYKKPTDGIPLPPITLRHRVHGSVKPDGFLRVGRTCAADIAWLLEAHGYDLPSFHRILDFGCGCGRVMRYLRDYALTSEMYGTDIYPEAIDWCRKHLSGIHFGTNESSPPTEYPDEYFDLIIAISVFTHLDEALQNAWLLEIRRILKPGGVLFATLLGSELPRTCTDKATLMDKGTGVVSRIGRTGVFKADGLPDFYQTTYHRRDYVERVWRRLFDVISFDEKAVSHHQDLVLLRK